MKEEDERKKDRKKERKGEGGSAVYILTEQLNEVNLQEEMLINCRRLPIFYFRFVVPLQTGVGVGVGGWVGGGVEGWGWMVGGSGGGWGGVVVVVVVGVGEYITTQGDVHKTNMTTGNIYRKG